MTINSLNPTFGARVKASGEEFEGVWRQATVGITGAADTVATAFSVQGSSNANSSGLVPGVVAGAESAGIGAGAAAWAAANPSVAGVATSGAATGVGVAASLPAASLDQGSNLNNKKVEGPLDATASTGASGVGVVETAFSVEGTAGINSSGIVPAVVEVAPSVPLVDKAAAGWSAANPSAASLAIGMLVALPLAVAKTIAKIGDRIIMPS